MLRLAVLGSGSGSNCQSIFNAIKEGRLDAEVVLVLSDNPDAYILERARLNGVSAEVMDCGGYKNKFPLEVQAAVAQKLKDLPPAEGAEGRYGLSGRVHAIGERTFAERFSASYPEYPSGPASGVPRSGGLAAGS